MQLQGNYYDVLGVSPKATMVQIERSYHRLACQFHPDRTQYKQTAHKVFVRISLAYQTLIDPQSRARYDAHMLEDQDSTRLEFGQVRIECGPREVSPEAIRLWTASAYEAFSRGQISTALEQCQRVMRFVDDDWTIYALLGDIVSGFGNGSRALGYYQTALALQPDNWVLQEKIRRLQGANDDRFPHVSRERANKERSTREILGVKTRQTIVRSPAADRG